MKTISAKRRRKILDDLARAEVRDGTYDRVLTRSEIARKAGQSKSPRKASAARRNGKLGAPHGAKGGRPPNLASPVNRLAAKLGVSRQWASHLIKTGKAKP